MSAYVEVETVYKDKDTLIEALQNVPNRTGRQWSGSDIQVFDEAVPLVGYVGKQRKEKADIIIRRNRVGGSSNDIGFRKQDDGSYKAIISEYDSGYYNQGWREKLNIEYGTRYVEKLAKKKGYTIKKTIDVDGSVKIKMSRWK